MPVSKKQLLFGFVPDSSSVFLASQDVLCVMIVIKSVSRLKLMNSPTVIIGEFNFRIYFQDLDFLLMAVPDQLILQFQVC